jgi:hypothetical protein
LQTDPQNCKTCGTICSYAHAGATCTSGTCDIGACSTGYGDCANGPIDGCETYIKGNDMNNCGACNNKCKVGQICSSGVCNENIITCSSAGVTCAQSGCYTNMFAISAGGLIAVDLANGRRLWTRATRGPDGHTNAKADCASLSVEGINNWRLPATFSELGQTLLHPGGLNGCPTCYPAIDQAAFPDTVISNDYLTDFYNTGRSGYDCVEFCDGRNNYQSTTAYYRCTHDPLP